MPKTRAKPFPRKTLFTLAEPQHTLLELESGAGILLRPKGSPLLVPKPTLQLLREQGWLSRQEHPFVLHTLNSDGQEMVRRLRAAESGFDQLLLAWRQGEEEERENEEYSRESVVIV